MMKRIPENLIKRTGEKFSYTHVRAYRAAYGFGEKFDAVDQAGKFVRACVREKCFRQGEYTYLSMPCFLTPDGFGLYVDTYVEVDFDFTKEGQAEISFPAESDGRVPAVYLAEGTPKQILFQFRSFAGMPRVFPKWTLGAWMSANRWHTQDEVEEQRRLAKELNFPHNVLVIEPWSDLTTHCLFNGTEAPARDRAAFAREELRFCEPWRDPAALIERLHADGLRVLLWTVPVYAQGDNLETRCNEALCLRENETVKREGDCVKNADGSPYEIPHTWCVGSMVPDFTSERATARWFERFAYLKELGIDGFKTDGGEFIHDRGVLFSDGTTGLEGQNRYCELYTEAFARFIGEEGIVFSRAGGQRTPSFSVVWAGDQESTWEEFRAVIKAGLSAGLSGISCWGFDIAGFSGYLPSRELYLRAVQTAAFLPVMQWHSDPVSNGRCDFTGAWTCNDRSPWNLAAYHKDGRLLEILREQFFLHYNLLPYQYLLMLGSARTGTPAMRHLALEFPEDDEALGVEDEFMLGDALLIAPVLRDYCDRRAVYLPQGKWFDLYSGRAYEGGWTEVTLQERHLPVFLREGKCVPLDLAGGKLCSDVGNDLSRYRELTFLVSGEGRFDFEDDLGNEISLSWSEHSHRELRNEKRAAYAVVHFGQKNIYG